jgi:nitrogen fixation protein NifZ
LVNKGAGGEVVQSGRHEEFNLAVYLVEFGTNRVVGCLEEELAAAS